MLKITEPRIDDIYSLFTLVSSTICQIFFFDGVYRYECSRNKRRVSLSGKTLFVEYARQPFSIKFPYTWYEWPYGLDSADCRIRKTGAMIWRALLNDDKQDYLRSVVQGWVVDNCLTQLCQGGQYDGRLGFARLYLKRRFQLICFISPQT